MNSAEFKNTVCRICLDENVVVNWSNTLVEYCDVTYKDCYYKYTLLKCLDGDPFSSMLCQICSNSLESAHALITKALDSHNFLLEVNCMKSNIDYSLDGEDGANCSTDFETILLEKPDTESAIEEQYGYESFDEDLQNSGEEFEQSANTEKIQFQDIFDEESEECYVDQTLQINNKSNVPKSMKSCSKSKVAHSNKEESRSQNVNKPHLRKRHKNGKTKLSKNESSGKNKNRTSKIRRGKIRQENIPCMCSFCSKILHNKYGLQKHERTHIANRERKAPCPICGVKFLEESYVKTHMQIHNENRVKKHKCEFCDKAFFEKGSLNVHRRIHLGQMIPCSLCSKEFFRQVDLEIHMSSHSASLINTETKKRSKYWVRCKYCDKNIVSTSYKSHTAAHLNEPLMKCSICSKEFFRRDSCTEHLKTIHKKTTDEYNNFIILYKKNRLSHLYLEQTAELKVNEH